LGKTIRWALSHVKHKRHTIAAGGFKIIVDPRLLKKLVDGRYDQYSPFRAVPGKSGL
jgi:hypothetical protein